MRRIQDFDFARRSPLPAFALTEASVDDSISEPTDRSVFFKTSHFLSFRGELSGR